MNWKLIKFTDVINPVNWWNAISGYYNKFYGLSFHVAEQIVFRSLVCKPCTDKGSCINCGCTTPVMYLAKDKTCPAGEWGKFMTPQEWKKYKEAIGLKFKLEYE